MKNKNVFHFVLLFICLIFGLYIIYAYKYGLCNAEGFSEQEESKKNTKNTSNPNILVDLISKMKNMSGFLTDMNMWRDRIEMFQMSPEDLARRELNKNKA